MRRIGDVYTDAQPHSTPFLGYATAAIADELRKLRLLKEFELKVLVGDDGVEDAGHTLQVVAADDEAWAHLGVKSGEPLFDEDQGSVAL